MVIISLKKYYKLHECNFLLKKHPFGQTLVNLNRVVTEIHFKTGNLNGNQCKKK